MSDYVDTAELDYWATHCLDCEDAVPSGVVRCGPCVAEASARECEYRVFIDGQYWATVGSREGAEVVRDHWVSRSQSVEIIEGGAV